MQSDPISHLSALPHIVTSSSGTKTLKDNKSHQPTCIPSSSNFSQSISPSSSPPFPPISFSHLLLSHCKHEALSAQCISTPTISQLLRLQVCNPINLLPCHPGFPSSLLQSSPIPYHMHEVLYPQCIITPTTRFIFNVTNGSKRFSFVLPAVSLVSSIHFSSSNIFTSFRHIRLPSASSFL